MQKNIKILMTALLLLGGIRFTVAQTADFAPAMYYRADNVDGKGNPGDSSTTTLVNLANPGIHDGKLCAGTGKVKGVVRNVGQAGTPYEYGVVIDGSHIKTDYLIGGGTDKVTNATWEFWLKAEGSQKQNYNLYSEHSVQENNNSNTRHDLALTPPRSFDGNPHVMYDEFPPYGGDQYISSSETFKADEFLQLVVVKKNNSIKIYRNGKLVDSGSCSETYNGKQCDRTFFGARQVGADYIREFKGQFSIIRMYEKALDGAQVLNIYNSTFPEHANKAKAVTVPSLYYRADNVDGEGNPGDLNTRTLVNLTDPGTHDGTLKAGSESIKGVIHNTAQAGTPFEYGVKCDGSYICADDFLVQGGVNKVTNATWEFWLKVDLDDTKEERGQLYCEYSSPYPGRLDARHGIVVEPAQGNTNIMYDEWLPYGGEFRTGGAYTPGKFMQLVFVKDGDAVRIYNNGTLVKSGTSNETYRGGAVTGTLFGARGNYNGVFYEFAGQFNIIRVYDTALTDKEVLLNYKNIIVPLWD